MKRSLFICLAVLSLFLIGQYAYSTTTQDGNRIVSGTLAVTGHTTFEGVTSTGATGSGKLVYDTSPTIATAILTTPNIGSAAVNGMNYCADAAGSGTTYTCTVTGLSAYTTGMLVTFKPGTASSGASTLNITGTSTLGAKSIKSTDGSSAMAVDDLLAAGVYTLEYDGTNFRILDGPDGPWKGLAAVGYTNSWADFGGAFQVGQYKKDINQRVCFRGLLNATNNQLTIVTMPSGYRMSSNGLFPSLSGNAVSSRLNLNSDGTINFGVNPGGAFASLEDICYSTR